MSNKNSFASSVAARVSSGVPGLDHITHGGLLAGELYVVQGPPGSGKTLCALQFLKAGIDAGERCMLVTFSQREPSIRAMLTSHGLKLEGLVIHEMASGPALDEDSDDQLIFSSHDLELAEKRSELLEALEKHRPERVVFDGISHFRLIATTERRYRAQLVAIRDYFAKHSATVLLTDNQMLAPGDGELQALAHGVFLLELEVGKYGEASRTLEVRKLRNSPIIEGRHDLVIRTGGMQVFPRRAKAKTKPSDDRPMLKSGNPELDELLGHGPPAGTSTLFLGPAGSGKSSIAALYALALAKERKRSSVLLFDETPWTYLRRCDGLGLPVRKHVESGTIRLHAIRPASLGLGRLMTFVRDEVVEHDIRALFVDSLSGYLSAMAEQKELIARLQQLMHFLSDHGIYTFILLAQQRRGAAGLVEEVNVSFLADTVVMFRVFEHCGRIRHALTVYKKRCGEHERTIRELHLETGAIRIGEPLSEFEGMLDGHARFMGRQEELIARGDRSR